MMKGGEIMDKSKILLLIASICLLFGSVINLLNSFVKIPFVLTILAIPALIAAIVLYAIYAVVVFKK